MVDWKAGKKVDWMVDLMAESSESTMADYSAA